MVRLLLKVQADSAQIGIVGITQKRREKTPKWLIPEISIESALIVKKSTSNSK
jgi:hypothetical protein